MLSLARAFLRICLLAVGLAGTCAAAASGLPPLAPGAFTVVVIPDTQGYFGDRAKRSPDSREPVTNPVLARHIDWILANRETERIAFVTHVGDIVEDNRHAEWRVARHAFDRLHGVVPYALCVGNHDMETDGDASLFQRYFGADRFAGFAWYAGTFEPDRPTQHVSGNNVNSVQVFSAGGIDFVHLSIECNAPDDVLAWADSQLTRHAARFALVTTHMDLGPIEEPRTREEFVGAPKGRMRWHKIHGARGNTAEQMWEKLFRRHANLRFIFSGDQSRTVAHRLEASGDAGNAVHSLMSDYTSSGPLRLLRFEPAAQRIEVITYDTTRDELVTAVRVVPDPAQHRFAVPLVPVR